MLFSLHSCFPQILLILRGTCCNLLLAASPKRFCLVHVNQSDTGGGVFALLRNGLLKNDGTVKMSELEAPLISTKEPILSQNTRACFRLTGAFNPLCLLEEAL